MDASTIIVVGQIVNAIATVGVPAVRKIVDQFENEEEITIEDLQKIDAIMKEPEEYFKSDT